MGSTVYKPFSDPSSTKFPEMPVSLSRLAPGNSARLQRRATGMEDAGIDSEFEGMYFLG